MPVLHFHGFPHTHVYHGPSGYWQAGDQREVEEVEAARLLRDFPGAFTAVEPPKPDPIKAPPRSVMVPEPPVARAAPKRSTRKRATKKKAAPTKPE